jgi:hypothetical protein
MTKKEVAACDGVVSLILFDVTASCSKTFSQLKNSFNVKQKYHCLRESAVAWKLGK